MLRVIQWNGNENLLACSLLAEEFHRLGLRHAMLCPGSRSAPLAVAFARHGGIRCEMCHDERAAAFRALGVARSGGRPAVVICTSGTAVANLLPAAVEAHQDRVPLLLLSADRPPELRASGANQCIDQPPLLHSVTRFRQDMPCPGPDLPPAWWLSTADECWRRSLGPEAGPAWLNCMFREPLAPISRESGTDRLASLGDWPDSDLPWTGEPVSDIRSRRGLGMPSGSGGKRWKRPLILLGEMDGSQEAVVQRLVAESGWPALCDIAAGVRPTPTGCWITHGDWLLECAADSPLRKADGILRLGGLLVSKTLQRFHEEPGRERIHLDPRPQRWDEGHCRARRLEASLEHADIAELLLLAEEGAADWSTTEGLAEADALCEREIRALLDDHPASEAAVARELLAIGPKRLFAGNSLPIRHLQRVRLGEQCRPRVLGNRGASGIDGLLATAIGVADTLPEEEALPLLIGDTSLLHDLNSLQLAARCRRSLRIVVLNNGGGAIFDRLPIREHGEFQDWFRAPLDLDAVALAGAFGLPARRLESAGELRGWMAEHTGRASLAEFRLPFEGSRLLEEELADRIRRALEELG